jgi:hypothetical protein
MPIGQRDALLMRLREKTFGPALTGLAACPHCGEQVEINFPLVELYAEGHEADSPFPLSEAQPQQMKANDFEISFRLPNSNDLKHLPVDPDAARLALLQTCVVAAHHDGQVINASDLSQEAVQALMKQMDQVDPLANIHLPLSCPACNHSWDVLFDIVSFFWSEINAWAQRFLREIHILASAYGWREADILSMSAWRRQRYLELIGV